MQNVNGKRGTVDLKNHSIDDTAGRSRKKHQNSSEGMMKRP